MMVMEGMPVSGDLGCPLYQHVVSRKSWGKRTRGDDPAVQAALSEMLLKELSLDLPRVHIRQRSDAAESTPCRGQTTMQSGR